LPYYTLKDDPLNIQSEHLENHTARLTVEIEPERLDTAKRTAARQIARRVNIPGFRKGKAPYHIVVQYVGEASILNDAVEDLSQEVYREMLDNVEDIQPYGPGAWEDFKIEPNPTFIYTVPLQPTVELGDYRSVRKNYEPPTVDDSTLEDAMKRLRNQEALVEESGKPVEAGNRVTVDIHSEFLDDAPETDEDTPDDEKPPAKGESFVHVHDGGVNLDPDDEPVVPGFIDALVGANVGDEREFELTVPEDSEDYKEVAGRKVQFHVTIKKIETVTLPELNDEFAARVSGPEEGEEPLTLLQLRMRMRENLEKESLRQYQSEFSNDVLDEMVDLSTVSYPEAMIEEQTNSMIGDFEERLRGQGVTLDVYLKAMNMERDNLVAEYREPAERIIKRSMVLLEIGEAEGVSVTDADIEARIAEMLEQFGEQADSFRQFFDTPNMRSSMRNDLRQQKIFDRVIAIAKGEAPEPGQPLPEETVAEAETAAEAEEEAKPAETETEEAADSSEESAEVDGERDSE
jgi:trigger factor